MTDRTFYIEVDGGHQDSSLTEIRRRAIDWLWTHPDDGPVTVYTSPRRRTAVGHVAVDHTRRAIFVWILPRGSVKVLYRNGALYKHLN